MKYKNMDNIDFDWDDIADDCDLNREYDSEYEYDSEWFDEHSTWRSIFFSFPKNSKNKKLNNT